MELLSETRSPFELAEQLEKAVREITLIANQLNDLRKHTRTVTVAAAYEAVGMKPVLAEGSVEAMAYNMGMVVDHLNEAGNDLFEVRWMAVHLAAKVKAWPEATR